MDNFNYPELPDIPEPPIIPIPELPHIPELENVPKIPDSVIEAAQATQDVIASSGIYEIIGKINQAFSNEAFRLVQSISDALQDFWSSTISQLVDTISNLKIPSLTDEEAEQLVESNRLWGRCGWTYMPSMPMSMFDTPPADIKAANKMAMQYCSDSKMVELFDELQKWTINHKDLESAIFCYQNKQYKACALLLCGLIESKIIRLQTDAKRPVGSGAVAKLKANYDDSGEKILADAMFTYNLLAYLETLFARGNGFKAEPDTLNRNYIGHGMNRRTVRKRDCIQLFLALNNLMQFFDLELSRQQMKEE